MIFVASTVRVSQANGHPSDLQMAVTFHGSSDDTALGTKVQVVPIEQFRASTSVEVLKMRNITIRGWCCFLFAMVQVVLLVPIPLGAKRRTFVGTNGYKIIRRFERSCTHLYPSLEVIRLHVCLGFLVNGHFALVQTPFPFVIRVPGVAVFLQ